MRTADVILPTFELTELPNKVQEKAGDNIFFIAYLKGKRAGQFSERRRSSPPTDTRNPRGLQCLLFNLLEENRISNGGGPADGREIKRENGTPELLLTGRTDQQKLLLHVRILWTVSPPRKFREGRGLPTTVVANVMRASGIDGETCTHKYGMSINKVRSNNKSYRKVHDAAMAKCQAVWNLCARSPKACEIYLEITGKSPTSPCPTRWNSYYDCITDILKVQETINEVLRKLGLAVLKEIEVQFLIEYINTSKPISEAIRSLEGDKETFL
ncbi:hypothetical protein EVAR_11481_1 [Eumeta japonica]|uniref:Uncharacterized protein n=1 Tax=Eumeta variegata TaxID=151549 RepID=A0A4C1TYU2_EUMVA|nr:hypothetical protein EVAR_11481_1 [Eumeta japonica]